MSAIYKGPYHEQDNDIQTSTFARKLGLNKIELKISNVVLFYQERKPEIFETEHAK